MKFIKTLILTSIFVSLCACNMKAPEDTHAREADEVGSAMENARKNLDNSTVKAAKLREEAAVLRMSGSPEDTEKALRLEREAAKLESDALNQLNPGY